MPRYVEVAVNVPRVSGEYHYHLPQELEGEVQVGQLVEVPFGQQRVQGVVLGFPESPAVVETRPVLGIISEQVVLTDKQLAFLRQFAHDTLSSLSASISLMLPPGLSQQADTQYTIVQSPGLGERAALSKSQQRLLDLLEQRGPLHGRQIDRAMAHVDWRASMRSLMRRGWVAGRPVLRPPRIGARQVRTAQLACPAAQAEARLDELGRTGTPALARRQSLLRSLLRQDGPVELSWLYAESGANLNDLRRLEALGLVKLGSSQVWRDPLQSIETPPFPPPPLTHDQQSILEQLQAGLLAAQAGQETQPYLLHGVTGSGKTEIYLRLAQLTLELGRQAIVLQPEISLTPQIARRFLARFPGQVGLVHSQLSEGERYDTWHRARSGQLNVILGPRSALFSPLPRLGLIVLDECHDDSYYQSEPPFYDARQEAIAYARICGAVCVLGSATPNITHTYQAVKKRWRYLALPARILAHRQEVQAHMQQTGGLSRYRPLEGEAETVDLPEVAVVDMRAELKAGNTSIFSRALIAGLGEVLERRQQAILFLNRRGTATYVFCRDCGHVLRCPRCDLPLTFHSPQAPRQGESSPIDQSRQAPLSCHFCGYQRQMPSTCPGCASKRIRQFGMGTEKVEAEVLRLFPGCRTLRWDAETTRQKGAHDAILQHFVNHRADVLIGTQMLAKGLDLPLVTLVGAVLADVGLNLPDYRSPERAFQVLTQVAGRAGRSPLGGQVILQTFQPEHYVIQAVRHHSYRQFYQQELEYRRQLGYPPFTRLVRLEYRSPDEDKARQATALLAEKLKAWLHAENRSATEMIGPAPCFFARLDGKYRWQIVLRGPDPAELLRGRSLPDWRVEVNPPSLL